MGAAKILNREKFENYKSNLSKKIEEKRSEGKDIYYLTRFVINYIGFNKRLAFTGKQIRELFGLVVEGDKSGI